jgi:hypothetical protein
MKRNIKVKAVWRKEPDMRLYVLALLELARQLEEQEASEKGRTDSDGKEAGDA